jgi:class 3 adenylate cyclase
MVQREDQLAALEDALLEARRGTGRLVVLAGEAGIGKTRLASELVRQAHRLGSAVLTGACSEAELSLPYLPFVEAIGNYLAGEDTNALAERLGPTRAELSQLFPQFGARGPDTPSDAGQAKLRLFEAIVSLLSIPAADRTMLLVIEDVHWADDSSRELLDHLARRLAGMRALVLVTYRSDEMHRRHPFVPTVRAWRRSGIAEVIELEPLPEAGVAEMVTAITGTEAVEPEMVDLLYERTEGNPFFLEEMLCDATARLGEGVPLERAALADVGIPETVRDTILQRISLLGAEEASVLEAAAVLGRSFDYPMLLAVSEASEDAVHTAVAAAIAQQLVEEHPGYQGTYRWRHALTQEATYESIVSPRRQAIHSRAADALAAAETTRPVDLANHLLWAGRFDEAVPICMRSAEDAERTRAFGEAAVLLERALPHISDPLERAKVVCRIGHDRALNGEPGVAQGFLSEGVNDLEALGESLVAARYRIILGRCMWERSQPEHARAEYERARDVLADAGPSAELAFAYVRLAGLHTFELDYEGGLEAAKSAVEIAEAAGADFERLYGLSFVGLGYLDSGDHERGLRVMKECWDEASAKEYWHVAQNVTWNDIWSRIHLLKGGLEERIDRYEVMPSSPLTTLSLASSRSYVNKARGDLHAARDDAELGIGLNERLGYRKMVWRCRVHLAEILVELGRYAEAEAVLPPVSARTELQDIVYDAGAQIRTRLANGQLDAALDLAREIRENAETLVIYPEPIALAVETFLAGGDLDAARGMLERAASHPAAKASPFIAEAQGRLAVAEGDPSVGAKRLRAAVDAADQEGYPLVALRSRVALAEALAGADEAGEAEAELRIVVAEAAPRDARLILDEARAAAGRLGIALPEAEAARPEAQPEAEILATGERLVTTLFADVRGYTGRSAGDAPAEVAERMGAFYRFAKVTVERYGGLVDKFAGDAVMASFNVSGLGVGHAVEALEAALTLRDKAALMDLPLGIGIATGAAILGRGASRENIAVTGVATNLASRLQAAAGPGEIILSEESHRRAQPFLAERGIELEREELELKGFDQPEVAHRLRAPEPVAAGAAARPAP